MWQKRKEIKKVKSSKASNFVCKSDKTFEDEEEITDIEKKTF